MNKKQFETDKNKMFVKIEKLKSIFVVFFLFVSVKQYKSNIDIQEFCTLSYLLERPDLYTESFHVSLFYFLIDICGQINNFKKFYFLI